MRQNILIPLLALIMIIGAASFASARMIHDFDCNNCHKTGMDIKSVSGVVCLDCHTNAMMGTTFPLHRTGPGNTNAISNKTFVVGDASDALGAVTGQSEAPGDETSHNWAAPLKNAAAGADQPSDSRFYGRQNASGHSLTCSRCHDPHAYSVATRWGDANPKLLKLGADSEAAMCNDCHVSWASDTALSEGGSAATNLHPMVTNYAAIAAASPDQYNNVATLDATAGEVALNATGGIDCMSCHGVHWTDSDAATTDGAGQVLSVGDGKVLKANGAAVDQANVAGVSLCQACHKYKDHGTGRSNPIGCLVCHGAHLEDTGGSMNNYMLRTDITTYLPKDAASGTVTGLALNVATAQNTRLWNYCFNCHNSADAVAGHVATWDCVACHQHDDTDGSWKAAGGCNTCHGYPPTENIKSDGAGGNAGYADGYELTAHFKDESTTLHDIHAAGSDYTFSCSSCHAGNGHIDGNFDDVFIATSNQLYNGNGLLTGGNAPAYNETTGSCSNVYCHSNGGPRGNTPTVNNPDVWEAGAETNACDICHGNDATDMVTRSNSATHIAHLSKGYSCQVCHTDTADSATVLAAGAEDGTHVDGTADVAFDATSLGFALGATSYGTSNGTCSVYCHSNGTTNVSPDWDLAASGACGSCHQYNNGGVATGSGAALGGAHDVHVFDASGPQLACTICHTHNGATGAANSDHVNGAIDKVTNYMDNVCNPCHGSTNAGVGDDAEPVWTTPGSVTCETCHSGSVIADITGGVTTPAMTDFDTAGHGKGGAFPACTTCHTSAADNNHLGALGDTDRINTGLAAYNPSDSKSFCQFCHGVSENGHYANSNSSGATDTSTDGTHCVVCHDPHGQRDKNSAVLDALLRANIGGQVVTGFTDRDLRASYYKDGADLGEGICQTCHDPNEVSYFNRTTVTGAHGGSGKCISCHPHSTSPAFKASCNGCHGDETTGQFWPDGDADTQINAANDEAGEHAVHILAIGQRLGYGDYTTTMYTDVQQKAICEYCHAGTTNDGDHGLEASLDADVFVDSDTTRHAKSMWGAADADASYNNTNDTCSNIDCHNGKLTVDNSYGWHDGANNPGCILCHNDITDTGIATGQTHAAHTGAAATYGATINCASCHQAATNWSTKTKPAGNHIDGSFDIGGTVTLTYSGTFGTSFGSCGTNVCHEDGTGGAPADNGYTWGTAEASACGICHAATPTSYDHSVHLSGTYGPNLGTDCSGCHVANANNTSMASMTTHMNGTVTFNNVAVPATPYEVTSGQIGTGANDAVDSCDLCHGGNTAANIAKDYWTTATRVTCESCHGDYTAAEIGGVTAPTRASTAYDSWGHGRTTGNAPNQSCSGCHAESSAHISGALGQDRLDTSPNNNYDFAVDGEKNNFCNDCHTTVGSMNVHFDNDNTAGGTSTDGLYCVTCHDPHGQDSFDAMVKADVGGNTVAGFTDRSDRTKYRDASFTGVCQTCHDTEVDFFNQSTDDNATHNPGSNCTSCHPHTTSPAFKAACNGCHGDNTTGQYWPDGDTDTQIDAANDDAGRHDEHVLVISQKLGYGDINALLGHADTDARQKAICAYCHAVNDDDHALEANLPAEVFDATVLTVATDVAKKIWDGSTDADATYTKATGTCATVDCHNGKTTTTVVPYDFTWNGANSSNCVMCHDDVTADATSHTIHTNSGTWNIGCSECHAGTPAWGDTTDTGTQTAPSSGHMNGSFAISGGSRTFTYSSGNCSVNECHNDGTNNAADVAAYDWDTGATVGNCVACHGASLSTNNHPAHSYASNGTGGAGGTQQFVNTVIDCDDCHSNKAYQAGTAADHFDAAINFKAGITYSGDTDVTVANNFGTCSTLLCHSNGQGGVAVTPAWNRAATSADDCTICHGDGSGGNISNSHDDHTGTNGATTYISGTSNQSTSSEYRFDCGLCHGTTIANHINGSKDLVAGVAWGGTTCGTNDCHQDGRGGAPAEAPNWATGFAAGDPCAKCHLNSPSSNAHHEHEVGFHYDAVYSGLTGFLPVEDADSYDGGLDDTVFDQLRGHGGNIGGGTGTSTATTITCYVCHYDTVRNWYNANNTTCAGCHTAVASPSAGDMAVGNAALTIFDKSKHVQPTSGTPVQVVFFPQTVRSKAQLRDDLADVAEISNNWNRVSGYKAVDGSSYDEQPDTLDNLSTWNSGDKTCTTSCHLWEANRVDKSPVDWEGGSIMCIDCHTRLPK